ncbi:MAG: Fic family protein [Candidatus Delongbacteria bacterium]|nr:Fic family protein [Candidatus Delongbacteria bacterium]
MEKTVSIWSPISFDEKWLNCDTSKFDDLAPSWYEKRQTFKEGNDEYEEFLKRLKRQHAIETGIVEKLYDLEEGITETFIKEGFVESYLSHGDTNISPQKLLGYLNDHFEAMDYIFDMVKNERPLTISFIKELHQLITKNQDTTAAINSLGEHVNVELLKGEFKKHENNPRREDGTVFIYCPPIQVDSEMENLITIYKELKEKEINPIILAAWFHHAFTQIHPFQDGNGRMARLLASLILIQSGLFPFTVKRNEKVQYIKALENADNNEPLLLVDFFSTIQKRNIEAILNFKLEKKDATLTDIAQIFKEKIEVLKTKQIEDRKKKLAENSESIYCFIYDLIGRIKDELREIIPNDKARIFIKSTKPEDKNYYWYTNQIAEYASKHNYYFNKFLPRGWYRFSFSMSKTKRYDLIISIHHYSFEDSVLAIGSFVEFIDIEEGDEHKENATNIPINIEPYTLSLETSIEKLRTNIESYVRDVTKIGLTLITNEII